MKKTPLGPTPYDEYRKTRDMTIYGNWGERNRFHLPNGYVFSCIKWAVSDGYCEDQFEIAVLDPENYLFVTDRIFETNGKNYLGYQTERDVLDKLRKVAEL